MATGDLVDDQFLADIDDIRGIPDQIGIRPDSIIVRVVSWPGNAPGQGGGATITDTPLLTGIGQNRVKVKQVSSRDALASGGLYTNQDVRVGPMTPGYLATGITPAAGVQPSTIDPPQATAGTVTKQIYFRLTGANYQTPMWFERIGDELVSSTQYFLILRRSGTQQPGGVP